MVCTAPGKAISEREPLEESEGSLANLRECLHYLEFDLRKSQDKVSLFYHDLHEKLFRRSSIINRRSLKVSKLLTPH